MSRTIRLALSLGVVLALTAGISAATGAIGSGGTVHTCITNIGGGLRAIDTDKGQKCLTGFETPLNLNQQGPKGDPGTPGAAGKDGAQGPKGDKGDAGPAGTLGKVFDNPFPGGLLPKLTDKTFKTVSSKVVPAGKYMVWAKGAAFSIEGDWFVTCNLFEDGAQIDTSTAEAGTDEESSYVLMAPAGKAGDSHTLEVKCQAGEDDAPATFISNPRLMAIPIDSAA